MNRQKLMLVALISAMAMLGLSACNRAAEQPAAQGSLSSAVESAEQSATLPATEVPAPTVAYADVVEVKPVTVAQEILGTVTDTRELVQTSTEPRQVCADVVVQERLNATATQAGP